MPLEFDDGLSVERFHFVEHPAEAVFQVSVVVEDHIEHDRRRVPRLDPAGLPVEDAAGRVVTYEVP